RAIWRSADMIWTALGDSSDDINWYSRRASLSAVYSATVLYWLGDDSEGNVATWAFLDRRIDGVLRASRLRARLTGNPLSRALLAGPSRVLGRIHAPPRRTGFPGTWSGNPTVAGPARPGNA
ncbi:COQ9 family protein, partial [Tropicimonas sp.]|uniref:COQ9 family protein n=1 Tax=Tropicimonas sp. TaxID=2067044 RepID=UPI003A8AA0E2